MESGGVRFAAGVFGAAAGVSFFKAFACIGMCLGGVLEVEVESARDSAASRALMASAWVAKTPRN